MSDQNERKAGTYSARDPKAIGAANRAAKMPPKPELPPVMPIVNGEEWKQDHFLYWVTITGRKRAAGGAIPNAPSGQPFTAIYPVWVLVWAPDAYERAAPLALRAARRDGFHPSRDITTIDSIEMAPFDTWPKAPKSQPFPPDVPW